MTTKDEISVWFDRGKAEKADYMIVVCDTFDHEDYPVYATRATYDSEYKSHNGSNMQRIMEVYDLRKSKAKQLAEVRAFNGPV